MRPTKHPLASPRHESNFNTVALSSMAQRKVMRSRVAATADKVCETQNVL